MAVFSEPQMSSIGDCCSLPSEKMIKFERLDECVYLARPIVNQCRNAMLRWKPTHIFRNLLSPNVKLSHPERAFVFDYVRLEVVIRATQAAKRLGVGCSALLG